MVNNKWILVCEQEHHVIIESDEEIDGVFSCLFEEKRTGMFWHSVFLNPE